MRIGFRTDASLQIGTGHVMRCLTLADALRERGAQCVFFCRPHAGNLIGLIEQFGYAAVALPTLAGTYEPPVDALAHAAWLGTDWATDAAATCHALGPVALDWMVVDHYALDRDWEQALRPHCKRMMVIDDLADRPHDCDMLLDQNLGRSTDDYCGLTSEGATLLTGPQFALLRPEFARLRPESLARRVHPTLKQLLITMGGVDKDNVTGKVLMALQASSLPPDLKITVVMGPQAPWLNNVREQSAQMPWNTLVLVGVNNMAELMANSDLAIGAAGGTSWERCCMGLPTLMLVLAENQRTVAVGLQNIGAALAAEHVDVIGSILNKLLASDGGQEHLSRSSRAAAGVTDGVGVTRICEQLMVNHA